LSPALHNSTRTDAETYKETYRNRRTEGLIYLSTQHVFIYDKLYAVNARRQPIVPSFIPHYTGQVLGAYRQPLLQLSLRLLQVTQRLPAWSLQHFHCVLLLFCVFSYRLEQWYFSNCN